MNQDVDDFAILDLGGGTLTLTSYRKCDLHPKVMNRDVASGGGMRDLTKHIFISLNKIDFGGETKSLDFVNSALRACKQLDSGDYLVPYRLGTKTINIADSVIDGMSKWITDNPSIADILAKTSQILVNGGLVFAMAYILVYQYFWRSTNRTDICVEFGLRDRKLVSIDVPRIL